MLHRCSSGKRRDESGKTAQAINTVDGHRVVDKTYFFRRPLKLTLMDRAMN